MLERRSTRIAALLPLLFASASALQAQGGPRISKTDHKYEVTFEWRSAAPLTNPAVAGDFNNWSRTNTPFKAAEEPGLYTATAVLTKGEYAYKFVSGDDVWILDQQNPRTITDAQGFENSLLVIEESRRLSELKTPPSIRLFEIGEENYEVHFRWKAEKKVEKAYLVGTFNNWEGLKNQMKGPDVEGYYHTAIYKVLPGRHEYKILVNGSEWLTDPMNPEEEGGNSLLELPVRKEKKEGEDMPYVLPEHLSAVATEEGGFNVTFRWKPDAKPADPCVAGSFNEWNPKNAPMSGPDGDGNYFAIVPIPAGSHTYKFVASPTDEFWHNDPRNPYHQEDGLGGKNSLLILKSE